MDDFTQRALDVARKVRALIPFISDETNRGMVENMVQTLEHALGVVIKNNIPCPENMREELEELFNYLESVYQEKATS